MKKLGSSACWAAGALICAHAAFAEDFGLSEARLSRYSVALNMTQASGEFGAGVDLTSPYWPVEGLTDIYIALRYAGNLSVMRAIPMPENTVKALPYSFHRFGLTWSSLPTRGYRLTLDAAGVVGVPNKYFGSNPAYGVYVGAGVELNPNLLSRHAYFFHGGAMITNGVADNVAGSPSYLSGLVFSAGWRYFLGS